MKKTIKPSLIGFLIFLIGISCFANNATLAYSIKNETKLDPLMPFVQPERKFSKKDFDNFLKNLTIEQQKALKISLCKGEKAKKAIEAKTSISVNEIKQDALWASSHWLTYKFKDEFDYHETVKWVAKKLNVPKVEQDYATTFQLEHLICVKLFEEMWNKLTPEEREKVLKDSGLDWSTLEVVGIGAAFLMSPVISSVFSLFFIGTIGNADMQHTTAFIVQIHYLKIEAMKNSNIDINQYILKSN